MFTSDNIRISNESFNRRTCYMCPAPATHYALEKFATTAGMDRVFAPYCHGHSHEFAAQGYRIVPRKRVDAKAEALP